MIFTSLWSRFNSLAEFGPEETHGVELARLYEENYVVITPADKIPPAPPRCDGPTLRGYRSRR
jgi:hypothetical protein